MRIRESKRSIVARILLHAFLICAVFVALFPVYATIAGSFKSLAELYENSWGLPAKLSFNNYRRLLSYNSGIIMRTYLNSLIVAGSTTILTLVIASMAGYAFSKFNFKGKNFIFVALLMTMMVPQEINITPMYIIFSRLKWLNTYQVQILPSIANVFAMFMFRQYMDSLPDAMLEAARIDGAGHWCVFRQIVVPVSVPTFGALAILTFLGKWNDFLYPKIMIDKVKYMPIMVILPMLNESEAAYSPPWDLLITGCTIVIIPLIVLFLCFQDKFLASVTIGAVKG